MCDTIKAINKKQIILGLGCTILLFLFLIPYLFLKLKLVGKQEIEMEYQQEYQELGAISSLFSFPITPLQVGSFVPNKIGTQTITYKVENVFGTIKQVKRKVKVKDRTPPVIVLKGESEITMTQGEKYVEPGFTMIDEIDGNLTKQVTIENPLDSSKIGDYQITYSGMDRSKNKVSVMRTVHVVSKELTYKSEWNTISNAVRTWWSGNKKDHIRPVSGAGATEEEIRPYQSYYMGPDDKTIYLTFDEGSNETYTKEIVEVLNKNNVKGTFFFCKVFIESNPELMKLLAETGHSVGNHTAHHKTMADFANEANFSTFVSEIREVEQAYYSITGKTMDKVYREPRGEFSLRSLAIIRDMGYKSFFWSADYLDWKDTVSADYALENYMQRYHNGAIYLIHPKNKGNYQAMDQFIKNMKNLGYEFGLVKDIQY